MRQDGLTNANPHNTNENFGEGSIDQISTSCLNTLKQAQLYNLEHYMYKRDVKVL